MLYYCLFALYLISIYYFGGLLFCHLLKLDYNDHSFIVIGFALQIALIQFLGWWMVAFRKSSTAFACLTIAVLLISAAGGLYIFINGKRWKKLGKPSIESLILIAVTFFLCINLHLFYRPDADDSFYVSNVLLFSSSDILNSYDSSFGNPSLGTVPMYDFQIWESYLSVFARFTGISPSILCHFIMSPVLLVVTISALGTLGNTLFSGMKKQIYSYLSFSSSIFTEDTLYIQKEVFFYPGFGKVKPSTLISCSPS